MMTRLAFAAAFVSGLALARPAGAQDDADLARALARRGWFDLAEDLCGKMEQGPSRAVALFIRAEIKLGQVDLEPDFEKASQGLEDAAALYRKFLDVGSGHPLSMEARANVGWTLARRGRLALDAAEAESEPSKQADLRKLAAQAFGDAEKYVQDSIETLGKDRSEKAQDTLMDLRLELPRVLIDHAKMTVVDDAARKKMLTRAKALLVDFEFDYGDRPIAFEAMLEGGKCLTELGEYRAAESKLRATFALRKRLAEAKITPNDYHKRIVFGAYIALAQSLQRAGRLPEARRFVDQILKEDKTLEKEWAGPALKMEKAKTLFKMNDVAGALALAAELLKQDPDGHWGYAARNQIKKWGETGASIRFTPEQMMTAADSSMDREQFRDALRDLRRCIEACRTDEEKRGFLGRAYFKMGECYQALHRNYEAAFCYEKVFTLFPNDANAPKACYEAVRCYNAEFSLAGDPRDEAQKEKFLTLLANRWPRDPAARNLKFVQAEKAEKAGDLKGAAELYRQVGDDAEAYESALVAQGYCYYADAARKYEKNPRTPALEKEAKEGFRQAEAALTTFLTRAADPSKVPSQPEQQKARTSLVQVANQQLAYIYMHEGVGKPKEALSLLAKVAKGIPSDDERIARVWATQIQAHLALHQLEEATGILDRMFDAFPDTSAIARACKSVAIKLDGVTLEMIRAKGDPAKIRENLRRISRYYAKWLNLAPALNMRITLTDVLSVAETLYMIAKQINGLDDNVISFVDLHGRPVPEAQYFNDAAFVHALLTEGKVGKLPDRERIVLMTRLARCVSFKAETAADWGKAKDLYENIMSTYKVLTPQGVLDPSVLQTHRELLGIYVEEGYVYFRLGMTDRQLKFQFDNASTVFSNVLRVVQAGSEPWWQSKFMVLRVLFERGAESDLRLVRVGLDNLERNYPTFDSGKYHMKDKFLELKKQVAQVVGSDR